MFDRTTPSKEATKSILSMIERDVPKDEIFSKTAEKYPGIAKDEISLKIASFISDEVKGRYRIHSYILSLIFLIVYLTFMISPESRASEIAPASSWAGLVILTLIVVMFIIGFLRFKLWYYTTTVSYYSLLIILFIYYLIVYPFNYYLLISSVSVVLSVVYAYLIRKRVFPNITFWGLVKKVNGKYVF